MPAPAPPFALFRDDPSERELLFAHPSDILIAETPDAFAASLEEAEKAHRAGRWLAGYLSYEAGYLLEPKLAPLLPDGRRAPLLCLGVFDEPLERERPAPVGTAVEDPIIDPRAGWSLADYEQRFERLHRYLREGDCYQGNLTFPIHARWSGDPLVAFDALIARQPVKYGALIALGDPVVLSRSPELFFEVTEDGWIETHPMKGTAPRGKTEEEDRRLREFLKSDPKNQAENRMIVDLLRNDISRISQVGTLHVPELFALESYPTLHQMVSRIRAKTRPGLTIVDLFEALFPCGSITGAPKIRAMEALRELESSPRGVYCGAIGWVAPSGAMRFSVAIRTISLYEGGEAVYNVGSGVVADSTAEAEYAECLLKARFATGMTPASN